MGLFKVPFSSQNLEVDSTFQEYSWWRETGGQTKARHDASAVAAPLKWSTNTKMYKNTYLLTHVRAHLLTLISISLLTHSYNAKCNRHYPARLSAAQWSQTHSGSFQTLGGVVASRQLTGGSSRKTTKFTSHWHTF